MTFSVEPHALRAFGSWLDEIADQTEQAISYSGHARIDDGGYGNLMLMFVPAVEEIASATEEIFRHLHRVVDASATGVFDTARFYEDTDAATATALEEAAFQ